MTELERLSSELARLRTRIEAWERAQELRVRRMETTIWWVAGAVATGVGAVGPTLVQLLSGS